MSIHDLQEDIKEFVSGKDKLSNYFEEPQWNLRVADLADIFEKQNSTNLKLQGCNGTLFTFYDALSGFIAKLLKLKL